MAEQETITAQATTIEAQEAEIERLRERLQAQVQATANEQLFKLPTSGDLVRPFSRERERPDTLGLGQAKAAVAPEVTEAVVSQNVGPRPGLPMPTNETTAEVETEALMAETARTLE
jgi:hypothetical protein